MGFSVKWMEHARKEAKDVLPSDSELAQLQEQVNRLTDFGVKGRSEDLPIKQLKRPYHRLWEMRLKGGAFGNRNVRVFFAVIDAKNIVILGVRKKEKEKALNYVYAVMLGRLKRLVKATGEGA